MPEQAVSSRGLPLRESVPQTRKTRNSARQWPRDRLGTSQNVSDVGNAPVPMPDCVNWIAFRGAAGGYGTTYRGLGRRKSLI